MIVCHSPVFIKHFLHVSNVFLRKLLKLFLEFYIPPKYRLSNYFNRWTMFKASTKLYCKNTRIPFLNLDIITHNLNYHYSQNNLSYQLSSTGNVQEIMNTFQHESKRRILCRKTMLYCKTFQEDLQKLLANNNIE